ncbi:MAG: hypothetical protein GX964_04835 [Syntrophomonadaceae bacterium]|jgi:uncharacterized protein YrrD|nr:hypothetical protein [Syntrophomonadaceae bacterium]
MNARNLLGMPVVVTSQGELIGEVCDLVLKRSLKVEGLVVKGKGSQRLVKCPDFIIGEDSVLVTNTEGLKPYVEREELSYKGNMGQSLLDVEGREVGIVSDVILEPETRETIGVEISEGLIRDFLEGRRNQVSLDDVQVNGIRLTVLTGEGSARI